MLKNEDWELLNELVAFLYGTSNSEAVRRGFLTRLMALIEFDLADFNLPQGEPIQNSWLGDPVVVSIFDSQREQSFISLYETKYSKLDYVNWIFVQYQSMVYRESDLINDKVRRESSFYKEYLAQYDLGSVAGMSVVSAGKLMGAVTLYKSEKKGDFSKRDLYVLQMLLPHLQNVLESKQGKAEKEREQAERMLKYQYGITKKEQEMIVLILRGCSNAEISQMNQISINTVKSHIANIFVKLGVKSRTQLVYFMVRNRAISLL